MTVENKRVYELAKEYEMTNKDFIEYLEKKLDIKVKSHSSNLTPAQISKIKASFTKGADSQEQKKPKAFVIKKVKAPETVQKKEEKKETVNVEKKSPEVIIKKPEVKQSAEVKQVQPEQQKKEEIKPKLTPETKTEVVSPIRSLLEYNNRNSQKRRQEMMAANRQKSGENQDKQTQRFQNKPQDRLSKPDRQQQDKKPYFDKQKHQDNRNSRQDGSKQERSERPEKNNINKKPIQHHIISQEIYEGKSANNTAYKKKNPKEKKKQYKNKEEEQELISLEKAITQKHKKKLKDDNNSEVITQVVINQPITVGELADKIKKAPSEIVKYLMMQGILTTVNEIISVETQRKICENFGLEVLSEDLNEYIEQELEKEEKEKAIKNVDESLLELRAPVISIMGHVDHGKTTLLDSIRASKHKIVATEVGGITQSIGAYTVYLGDNKNKKIVFIDTPGHEAFTEMRARGAKATDIAILVVAADDGIMPQTIEAINHAKAAEVPIIVAINKIDKPSADPEKIMQQLTEYGLVPEEWGGETICVKVSALQGKGIDELLEYILLLAEVQNLRANKTALASGVIIEAKLDKGKGPVATLLVQNGTLHTGDCFVVGNVCGKIRALISDSGERIKEAGPSTPVEILGLTEVPQGIRLKL